MLNLADVFSKVNGNTFIGLDTLTQVVLTGGKSNPHLRRVQKKCIGHNVMIFQNRNSSSYGDMVHRRLQKEGKDPASFELSPRKWGDRIQNTPFIRHFKDGEEKFYLEVIFLNAGIASYLLDGKPIEKHQIIGLPADREDPDSQGGLSNKVIIRSYSIDSLVCVRTDGREHHGPFCVAL